MAIAAIPSGSCARPMPQTDQWAPAGSISTMCWSCFTSGGLPPRTPSTNWNQKGGSSSPSSISRNAFQM